MSIRKKKKTNFVTVILRFFFGFLIPYIVINGIIFFLFIQTPKINVVEKDSKDYEESKIKFTIESILPITSINTFFQESPIDYTKQNVYYVIDAKNNGTYQIKVISINKSIVNQYVEIETKDAEAPVINLNDALVAGNTLTFTVVDTQSGINFDSIYAINEENTSINPTYIDKASGTVQFKIDSNKKLTVHVEDTEGNSLETTFNVN